MHLSTLCYYIAAGFAVNVILSVTCDAAPSPFVGRGGRRKKHRHVNSVPPVVKDCMKISCQSIHMDQDACWVTKDVAQWMKWQGHTNVWTLFNSDTNNDKRIAKDCPAGGYTFGAAIIGSVPKTWYDVCVSPPDALGDYFPLGQYGNCNIHMKTGETIHLNQCMRVEDTDC